MYFETDEEDDFCAGVSKPARIWNPDKILSDSIQQEIRGSWTEILTHKQKNLLKRKEYENL